VAQRRQRNIYTATGVGGAVVVVIVAFVLVSVLGGKGQVKGTPGSYAIPAALTAQVEGVPLSALISNAKSQLAGGQVSPPEKLPPNAPHLSSGGLPEIMYIGADYCPYCAGERWALVLALSKFGTFNGLRGTSSSSTDINPSTPTFTFYGSTYTSKYLTFATDELETNTDQPLQSPTAQENKIINTWDVSPYTTENGSIPFVYLAGRYVVTGVQYDASPIQEMNFQDAVPVMTSGTSAVSKHVDAAAGYLVGDFCALTHDQPASVCSQVPSSLIGITTSTVTGHGSSTPTTAKKATTPTTTAKAPTTKKP